MAAELTGAVTALEPRGPGVAEYLGVFQRRPGLILIPLIVMSAIATLVAYLIPEKFESFTRFKVRDPGVAKDLAGTGLYVLPHKYLLSTMETDIKNRSFLTPIIDKFGLNEGYNTRDPEQQKKLFDYLNDNLKISAAIIPAGPDVIDIVYRGRDARKVADFVNEIRERFRDEFMKDYRDGAFVYVEKSKAGLEEIERDLSLIRSRYEAFIVDPDVALINAEQEINRTRGSLVLQLSTLEGDIKELEASESKINDQIAAEKPDIERQLKKPSKLKQTKLAERAQIATELTNYLNQGFTELTLQVKTRQEALAILDAEIAKLPDDEIDITTVEQNQVYSQLTGERLKITRDLDGKRKTRVELTRKIAEYDAQIAKIPELRNKRDEFDLKIIDLENRRSQQLINYTKAENTWNGVKGKGGDLLQVVEYARVEKKPVFPSIPIFLGIGAAVGLLLGIGLAFLKEFSGMTFSTPEQVQSVLPIPVLGEVGSIKTAVQRREEMLSRLRHWVIAVLIIALLGGVHVMYFTKSLSKYLPREVTGLMDKIYPGR